MCIRIIHDVHSGGLPCSAMDRQMLLRAWHTLEEQVALPHHQGPDQAIQMSIVQPSISTQRLLPSIASLAELDKSP